MLLVGTLPDEVAEVSCQFSLSFAAVGRKQWESVHAGKKFTSRHRSSVTFQVSDVTKYNER